MSALPPLVDAVTDRYIRLVDDELPGALTGLYLVGSVAMGDFRPGASDIDFVAVMAGRPDSAALDRLRYVHARLASEFRRPFFDGSYVTLEDLQGAPAEAPPSAHVHESRFHDRGSTANPVTWHELAMHGITVRGPEPSDIGVWTDRATLVAWNRENMGDYWRPWHARASRPLSILGLATLGRWAPPWGVLGVARQRFTIDTGDITSKFGAGEYALEVFPARWHRIVEECLRLRAGAGGRSRYLSPWARRRDTLAFMDMAMTDVLKTPR